MRKRIIAGNWKMNETIDESVALASAIKSSLFEIDDPEVVLCPPFTSIARVGEIIYGTAIELGAQNMYWEQSGAYTGEISPPMLKALGCRYVILGHSERRGLFGETDAVVNRKIKACLENGLSPIVCVGETLEKREAGVTREIVSKQFTRSLAGISGEDIKRCVIAYEPIWAIGTGRTATPVQAQEVHAFIRSLIAESFGREAADEVRIQYGGSVNPDNAGGILSQPDIDGALVGGASLKAESFCRIVLS
ncbi:MAG: triose-phosphate isomerase [Candidatus Tritonobacter lacicola]|nr:triose-phosphate isomerase [Candidatus Tritonobacter lacicola]